MRYFAAGCAVAYTNHRGEGVALVDCPTPEVAAKEAERLNFREQVRETAAREAAKWRAIAARRQSVRYFAPDAFA